MAPTSSPMMHQCGPPPRCPSSCRESPPWQTFFLSATDGDVAGQTPWLKRTGGGVEVAEVSKIYHVSRMSGVPCHKGDLGHVPLQDPAPSVRTLWPSSAPSVSGLGGVWHGVLPVCRAATPAPGRPRSCCYLDSRPLLQLTGGWPGSWRKAAQGRRGAATRGPGNRQCCVRALVFYPLWCQVSRRVVVRVVWWIFQVSEFDLSIVFLVGFYSHVLHFNTNILYLKNMLDDILEVVIILEFLSFTVTHHNYQWLGFGFGMIGLCNSWKTN